MWQTLLFSAERLSPTVKRTVLLVPERFGVSFGAADHHDEIVRVADQSICRHTLAATLLAGPVGAERFPFLGEVLVQHRQSDVGQQRREDPAI
jgi:hypothetical protein